MSLFADSQKNTNGVLLTGRDGVLGGKVFYCHRGYRHFAPSRQRMEEYGLRWNDDMIVVDEKVLLNFRPGGHLPSPSASLKNNRCKEDLVSMREALGNELSGYGMEIGAGTSAFPVPLHCKVLYADRLNPDELMKHLYETEVPENLIIPDLITDIETLDPVGDESLDFIIGCHVIEHARNPIGAIQMAYRKLREGGKLLLVVPDKERTFDKSRQGTTLDHLKQDFEVPDRQRDYAHYEEFYKLAIPVNPWDHEHWVKMQFIDNYAIHYHVWDYNSFCQLLDFIQNDICRWSRIWTHPALGDSEKDIEFYALLTK